MYHRDLLATLNDLKSLNCEKCGSPLELYKFRVINSKNRDVNADALMVCFKCRLIYNLMILGRGVVGVKDVKTISASSWNDLLKSGEV
ncbi:MAG: hypothetical protein LM601_10280 [Candidatus Verstraetearchaeota archaeon]|nr:hypothetical protein [Candidatus Verstraetearchaeota archaeon]